MMLIGAHALTAAALGTRTPLLVEVVRARTAGTLSEARRSLFQNACWGLDRWCPGCQIRLIRTRAANLAAGQLLRPREHHSANACSPPPLLNGHVSSLPPY